MRAPQPANVVLNDPVAAPLIRVVRQAPRLDSVRVWPANRALPRTAAGGAGTPSVGRLPLSAVVATNRHHVVPGRGADRLAELQDELARRDGDRAAGRAGLKSSGRRADRRLRAGRSSPRRSSVVTKPVSLVLRIVPKKRVPVRSVSVPVSRTGICAKPPPAAPRVLDRHRGSGRLDHHVHRRRASEPAARPPAAGTAVEGDRRLLRMGAERVLLLGRARRGTSGAVSGRRSRRRG